MIYSSLEHYALITLQKEPGYIRRWMGPESLKKFELDQQFRRRGIQGFFLLNMEATLYLFGVSVIIHLVMTLLRKSLVPRKNDIKVKELGLVKK